MTHRITTAVLVALIAVSASGCSDEIDIRSASTTTSNKLTLTDLTSPSFQQPRNMERLRKGRSPDEDMLWSIGLMIAQANYGSSSDVDLMMFFVPVGLLEKCIELREWQELTHPSEDAWIRRLESTILGPWLLVLRELHPPEEATRSLANTMQLFEDLDLLDLNDFSDLSSTMMSERLGLDISRQVSSAFVIDKGDTYIAVFSASQTSAGPFNSSGLDYVEATSAVIDDSLVNIWLSSNASHDKSAVLGCEVWTQYVRSLLD